MGWWWRRPNPDERQRDFDREVRTHLELEAEDRRGDGMPPEAARYAAVRAFGNRALIQEEIRALWGRPFLDAFVLDLRYALRAMRRAPGFAALAVGSSALGIGACSVIFAVFNVAVFRPLPVSDPNRLMSVSELDRRTGVGGNALSYPDFLDLRTVRSFDGIAALEPGLSATIGLPGDPARVFGALVTANYFSVVRPKFALGRGFHDDRDDRSGAPPAVVLSHYLWQSGFGSDPTVLGRSIVINNRPATVVGVTGTGFAGSEAGTASEFWIPFSMLDEIESRRGPVSQNRQRHWLNAVGRLRSGVDARTAGAELDVLARTLNAKYAGGDENRGFYMERAGRMDPSLRAIAMTMFLVFVAGVALVLLAACANVANLLLGRATARRREIASRMALGATRNRLLRQLLTESLLLAIAGGVAGWALASYATSLAGLMRIPLGWPLDLTISLDYRVLTFCAVLSILTGVIFGLVPALQATKRDLVSDLKPDGTGSSVGRRFGLRNGLVVGQVAVCTVLLLATGLFLRSLQSAKSIDLGVKNRDLLLLSFDPALDHRPDAQCRQLMGDLVERARSVPGVQSVSITTGVPLTFIIDNSRFVPADRASDPGQRGCVRTSTRSAPTSSTPWG